MKNFSGWKYYNHALIPSCAPHDTPNYSIFDNKNLWKELDKKIFLIRWTSDFDKYKKSNWWYEIKDDKFDLNSVDAKKRYEIRKGLNNFCIKEINPSVYFEDLFAICEKAFFSWPKKYRPNINKEIFIKSLSVGKENKYYGAFSKDNGELCGYSQIILKNNVAELSVLRVKPEYEKKAINAAIIYFIVKELEYCKYISDGSRNIIHETNFQNYLEKYFGFRKAYCKLNVLYRPFVKFIIYLLYPFRKITTGRVKGLLKMEEIIRNQD